MAKSKKDENKKVEQPQSSMFTSAETIDQALVRMAPKMLEGGELHGQDEEVVGEASRYYKVDPQYVQTKLTAECDRLLKAAEAERTRLEAEKAKKEADEAAVAAAEAAALADGKVVVNVPRAFKLQISANKIETIRPGPQTMPLEWAEHWYSKANGVTIVGTANKK